MLSSTENSPISRYELQWLTLRLVLQLFVKSVMAHFLYRTTIYYYTLCVYKAEGMKLIKSEGMLYSTIIFKKCLLLFWVTISSWTFSAWQHSRIVYHYFTIIKLNAVGTKISKVLFFEQLNLYQTMLVIILKLLF